MKRREAKPSAGRWLSAIERVGNALPHPITLFALLTLAVVVISALCAAVGLSVTGELIVNGEVTETTVEAVSLLTGEGLAYIFTSAVTNFTTYAPLGMVLVAMLGVGVAEQSGLIGAVLKRTVQLTPRSLVTPVIVFLGVMSNIASDAGYVVLIPLGAMVFRSCGRHPLAGLAAAFAGVSGGFSANLIVGSLDPMLAGISEAAATIIDPNYKVSVMGNWYFLFVSTFLITVLGTLITDKVVEPRLAAVSGQAPQEEHEIQRLTGEERSALRWAGFAALAYLALLAAACIPQNSFFRNEAGELIGDTPLIASVVPLIALLFLIPGVVYGLRAGTFRGERDVCEAMSATMSSMGSFLALSFVSAQFINYFNYTKLGTLLALAGANFFKSIQIGLIPLMVIFVLFSAFMNLFIGSASAKWNILAPVFVPMFMLLGYRPELCQLAYRIGDSCTNVITPLMAYFAVIVVLARRYDPKAGIGTLIATMLPYSICFLAGWTLLMILWLSLGLPIGPGVGLYL